jgi:hypothetical protein
MELKLNYNKETKFIYLEEKWDDQWVPKNFFLDNIEFNQKDSYNGDFPRPRFQEGMNLHKNPVYSAINLSLVTSISCPIKEYYQYKLKFHLNNGNVVEWDFSKDEEATEIYESILKLS